MLDDGTQQNWSQYLDEFEETMLPIFQSRGYSRDTALVVWMLNRAVNAIQEVDDAEDETDG